MLQKKIDSSDSVKMQQDIKLSAVERQPTLRVVADLICSLEPRRRVTHS